MQREDLFKNRFVIELQSKDFNPKASWKLKNKSCTAVLFYCPWCPHCRVFKDTWIDLAKKVGFMNLYALNCEKQKRQLLKIQEELPELVKGYPTILFYKGGIPVEEYRGERSLKDLVKACMRICQWKK